MAQNIYDDEGFFAGYATLPRSVEGLDGAPEWPTLRAMLPPLAGRRVVDLGCGYGWFCRWAASEGAASVLGIDLSARMLEKATAHTDDARITYRRADLDQLALDGDVFDVAYSSLTVHYLVHLDALLTQVHRSLVPGGHFVFSAEHPVYTAPSAPQFVTGDVGGTVRRVWPLDGYLREGPRVTNWFADGVVKQHRTIGTYLRLLRDAGFTVRDLCEWGPTDEQVAVVPEWSVEQDRPMFMLVHAVRSD